MGGLGGVGVQMLWIFEVNGQQTGMGSSTGTETDDDNNNNKVKESIIHRRLITHAGGYTYEQSAWGSTGGYRAP